MYVIAPIDNRFIDQIALAHQIRCAVSLDFAQTDLNDLAIKTLSS